MPLLTNLHTNKHERLESFYTPEEIRKVLGAIDRTSKARKNVISDDVAGLRLWAAIL